MVLMAAAGAVAAGCSARGPSGAPAGGGGAAAAGLALSPAADAALIDWWRPGPAGVSPAPPRPPEMPPPSGSPPASAPRSPSRQPGTLSPSASPLAPAPRPSPSSPSPPPPSPKAPREWISVGLGGLWIGPEDGPRAHYLFARRQRGDELAAFARRYASFRRVDGEGDLVWRGHGAEAADAAERRMLEEWARQVAVEAGGDAGSSPPYGLALAWHRGAAGGGICDDLTVYLNGQVRAGPCGGGAQVEGRLAGDRLQRLYAWVDGLEPFQAAGEQGGRGDALLERLIFAGEGRRHASAAEIAAIESFAGSLHRELAAPPPSPATAPSPAPAGSSVERPRRPLAPAAESGPAADRPTPAAAGGSTGSSRRQPSGPGSPSARPAPRPAPGAAGATAEPPPPPPPGGPAR
jgi:hypothetical protein